METKNCNCECRKDGLLHWQILREDYDKLHPDYKNCGIVFFIKDSLDSDNGIIIRNNVVYTSSGSSGDQTDWKDYIDHTVGSAITELEEKINEKMNKLVEQLDKKYVKSDDIRVIEVTTKDAYNALKESGGIQTDYLYVISDGSVGSSAGSSGSTDSETTNEIILTDVETNKKYILDMENKKVRLTEKV